jgi:hypothetical protein
MSSSEFALDFIIFSSTLLLLFNTNFSTEHTKSRSHFNQINETHV